VLGFVDDGKSIDWISSAGGRVMNLLAKGSRKHCETQLRKTLDEHAEDVRRNVALARERGLAVNLYLEDWSNGYADDRATSTTCWSGSRAPVSGTSCCRIPSAS
jgi:D-citramalate synthase